MNLKEKIRNIYNYPVEGIIFRDITTLLRDKDAFKEAIILQAMYTYKNGDIGMDSGYDAERGIVARRAELVELSVCQDAIDILSNAGLFNLVMKNRPRKFGGGFIPGDFS